MKRKIRNKQSLRDSVSLHDLKMRTKLTSLWDSLRTIIEDSVPFSIEDSVWRSVRGAIEESFGYSDIVRGFVWKAIRRRQDKN